MRLPDMTAIDVLQRGRLGLANVPVLVLTQALWQQDAEEARRAGAIAVHEKPGRLAALRTLLLGFVATATR
jgi:CheY-like chemotaxis protein